MICLMYSYDFFVGLDMVVLYHSTYWRSCSDPDQEKKYYIILSLSTVPSSWGDKHHFPPHFF